MERGYIYKVTNIVNGKYYFGQTARSPFVRFKEHLLGKNEENLRHLHSAMKKYGKENFKMEIVDLVESDNLEKDLDKREQWWIEVYDSTNENKGYNLEKGGKGHRHSESAKEAISYFNRNAKFIHKGTINKRVANSELDKYLNDGWKLGNNIDRSKQKKKDIK